MYNLVNTVTRKVIKQNVDLTKGEVDVLNYAYALNTGAKLKYVLAVKPKKEYTSTQEKQVIVFKYQEPI